MARIKEDFTRQIFRKYLLKQDVCIYHKTFFMEFIEGVKKVFNCWVIQLATGWLDTGKQKKNIGKPNITPFYAQHATVCSKQYQDHRKTYLGTACCSRAAWKTNESEDVWGLTPCLIGEPIMTEKVETNLLLKTEKNRWSLFRKETQQGTRHQTMVQEVRSLSIWTSKRVEETW